MSLLTYNGISLPLGYHTGFSQEAVYDDSGVNLMYTKFDITVQAVINSNYFSPTALGLSANTTNAASFMKAIRYKLLQPRQGLTVTFNGINLLPTAQRAMKTVDARNGPQPQYCQISTLTNSTFLVNYRIVAHYWENNTITAGANGNDDTFTNQTGNTTLSNRWTEDVTIDACLYSTRTRSGKAVIRSDNVQALQVDDIRQTMCIVGVPNGFRRTQANYRVSPDGLGIEYTLVDQEVFREPPLGAYEASGQYIETTVNMGGQRLLECRVKLKSAKADQPIKAGLNQADLATLAARIVGQKLQVNVDKSPEGVIARLKNGVITIDLYENVVECQMSAWASPNIPKWRLAGLAGIGFASLCKPPFDNGGGEKPPVWKIAGTGGVFLKAAAYYDPTLVNTKVDPETEQFTTGIPIGQGGVRGG
jgi:hypothetical protein